MTHTCPRRAEGFGRMSEGVDQDEYQPNHGIIGQPRGCTYCGSMSPEDFLAAIRAGCEIGPTDKGYKLYVEGIPADDPDRLWATASSNHPASTGGEAYRPWKQLTRAEKKAVKQSGGFRDSYKERFWGGFIKRTMVGGKFYTQHFSEDQGWEFDQLWKDHKINWGYPGAPYVGLFIPGPSTQKKETSS